MAKERKEVSSGAAVVIVVVALIIAIGLGWYFFVKPKGFGRGPTQEEIEFMQNMPGGGRGGYTIKRGVPPPSREELKELVEKNKALSQ